MSFKSRTGQKIGQGQQGDKRDNIPLSRICKTRQRRGHDNKETKETTVRSAANIGQYEGEDRTASPLQFPAEISTTKVIALSKIQR